MCRTADDMKISGDDKRIITNTAKDCHTAYGATVIDLRSSSNIIYEWTFKMISIGVYAAIAIDSTFDAMNRYIFRAGLGPNGAESRKCYGLHCQGGAYYTEYGMNSNHGYLQSGFKNGDIMILRLNAKNKQVSFIKNGKDHGALRDVTVADREYGTND